MVIVSDDDDVIAVLLLLQLLTHQVDHDDVDTNEYKSARNDTKSASMKVG